MGSFDPYYTWLAIPPEEQPPHHYRLLGVRPFEKNPEVIENAADQRMAHLRSIQVGQHSELSQKLLNEVAAARVILLNPAKKANYDARLRARLKVRPAPARRRGAKQEISAHLGQFFDQVASESPRLPGQSGIGRRKAQEHSAEVPEPTRAKKKLALYIGSGVVGLVLVGLLGIWIAGSGSDTDEGPAVETALVFEWPKAARQEALLFIGNRPMSFPKSGPLVCPCKPGKYHIRATRSGFQPVDLWVKVKPGERSEVVPEWQVQAYVILEWPSDQRRGAKLFVDEEPQSLSRPAGDSDAAVLKIPLAAGPHVVRIERRGYPPFERKVTILEGDAPRVKPSWDQLADTGTGPEDGSPLAELLKDKFHTDPAETEATETAPKPPAEPREPLPVPPMAKQEAIARQLEDVYHLEQAGTEPAKVALAGQLQRTARDKYQDNPDERYVLLDRALRLAADGGDAGLMLEVAANIEKDYAVEPLSVQGKALGDFAASASSNAAALKSLMDKVDQTIDAALAAQQFDLAVTLSDKAYEACAKSRGKPYRKQAYDCRRRVQETVQNWSKFQAAREILQTKPDDPEANATAGLWYCVMRNDWETGLPHLAKGSDVQLRRLAQQEVSGEPTDDQQYVAFGDACWNLAQSREQSEKNALLLRAAHWYRAAEAGTRSALLRDKVAQRLKQLADVRPPPTARVVWQPRLGEPLCRDVWVDLLKWVDVERDGVQGDWRRQESEIGVRSSETSRLTLPVVVDGSYDVRFDFTPVKTVSCPAALILPVPGRSCLFKLFGVEGDRSGIETIDGKPVQDNPTSTPGVFSEGKRYRVQVNVRCEGDQTGIRVELDEQPCLQWQGNTASLSMPSPQPKRLGLVTGVSDTVFHKIQFRLVAGGAVLAIAGRADPAEIPPASPVPELAEGAALSRLALVVDPEPIPGVRSWTVETPAHRGEVRALVFSPDSDTLATAGDDGVIRFWEAAGGKFRRALVGHGFRINALAWTADGRRLASADDRGTIRIWDVPSGKALHVLVDREEWVSDIAWTADGKTLVSTGRPEGINFWDAASGKLVKRLERDLTGNHLFVACSHDGKMLATAGDDRMIRLWNPRTYQLIREMQMGEGGGWGKLTWSADDKTLVSWRSGVIYLWDPAKGTLKRKFGKEIGRCVLSPDGRTLLAAGSGPNMKIHLFDVNSGNLISEQEKPEAETSTLALANAPDGKRFAVSCPIGVRIVHTTRSGMVSQALPSHTGLVLAAAFSPNRQLLACGHRAHCIRVWEIGTCRLTRQIIPKHGPDSYPRRLAWSPDGKALATLVPYGQHGKMNSRILLWNPLSGSLLKTCNVDWRRCPALDWFPPGGGLAYGGHPTRLYSTSTGKRIREIDIRSNSLDWSPNGRILACRAEDGNEINLCAPETGEVFKIIHTPRSPRNVAAVAFSPDGSKIACSVREADGACVYDADRAVPLVELRGQHESSVSTVAWLDDGKTLVTGAATETCLWEADTGKLIRRIPNGGDVFSIGARLIAERGHSMFRVRSLDDGCVLQTVLSLAGRETVVLGPKGNYRGSRGAKRELVYIIQTDTGQVTLEPDDFCAKYDWKNDPQKVGQASR